MKAGDVATSAVTDELSSSPTCTVLMEFIFRNKNRFCLKRGETYKEEEEEEEEGNVGPVVGEALGLD